MDAGRGVQHRFRYVLAAGLAVVLGILSLAAVYATASLAAEARGGRISVHQHLERSDRLDAIRRLVVSISGEVGAYLVDPDSPDPPTTRERVAAEWRRLTQALAAYEGIAGPARRQQIDILRDRTAEFRQFTGQALDLSGVRRHREGPRLAVERRLALRDQLLDTISEIRASDEADFRELTDTTSRAFEREDRHLVVAVVAAVLLASMISIGVFQYLTRLERTVLSQYAAAVRTGAELESLSRRLLTAHEDERKRIARDLHDDFGQRMAALVFGLSSVVERTDKVGGTKPVLEEIIERLGSIAKDLQQLSRSLHPAVLDKVGLAAAIRSDCHALSQRTELRIDFKCTELPKRLPESESLTAYRVFQESVQNAMKHSRASQIDVSLTIEEQELVLRVKDYGCGFAPDVADRGGSLGLASMRERIGTVGGRLRIHSEPGDGTLIEAWFPVHQGETAGRA